MRVADVRYISGPDEDGAGGDADEVSPRRFWPEVFPSGVELTDYGFVPILGRGVPTVIEGDFEWDSEKATSNLEKHGISFFEAATVFADPLAIYLDDGSGVGTMVAIGMSLRARVLCVVHVERGDRDRIISARRATAGEREVYEGGDRT